ncbi:adenosyl cobinamide kinase/adenosyl cobinamide phosphate guanylyltransferase [Rubidibacter lacunae KORDI 51-2]|uniref:Adenosylcobinamide kinase n=1 Tax=Rubidibacter lacunae KORDI 51-2 TaxID=582515 RepID=U5DJR7_9CHRO|nr:bifunctional adenosylcobinamide kinase/adenosylcobinamide-phosphate guanylyltransferase [Rubidibacter lacunae]ERN41936.1 adenosyl cobinamide kinase/adenosyl cobinamide phosphate guanylyltransferase [Rubidibacter lacunae KORDI 51-2]
MQRITLITGPASSGKSEWAEHLAAASQRAVTYVATARTNPDDAEWQLKIARHAARRPSHWRTLEVPVALPAVLQAADATDCLLVDSLGTWVANGLENDAAVWEAAIASLIDSLESTAAAVIFVAEETGWGVVPAYPLGRQFRDRLGQLVRRLAASADTVQLVTGGYVLDLSALGMPLPPP